MALKWRGDEVLDRLKAAQIRAVNQTMAACVIHAKNNHPWQNVSATLEGSIDIADYARPDGSGVRGVWGSRDVRYALIHELGGTIRPVRANKLYIQEGGEVVATASEVEIPARPYLRPAADVEYPKLAGRIRAALDARPGGDA